MTQLSFKPWLPTTRAPSSSLCPTPSAYPNAPLKAQWTTPTALSSSRPVPHSSPSITRAKHCTPDKATTCTYSLVSSSLASQAPLRLTICYVIGLGLGAILARAKSVTDTMVEASSLGLANSLTLEERDAGLLYPRIERSTSHIAFLLLQPTHCSFSPRNQLAHRLGRYPRCSKISTLLPQTFGVHCSNLPRRASTAPQNCGLRRMRN